MLDYPSDIANCLNAIFATNISHSVPVAPSPSFPERNHVHRMPSAMIDVDNVLKHLNELDLNKARAPMVFIHVC